MDRDNVTLLKMSSTGFELHQRVGLLADESKAPTRFAHGTALR
jgi:hypothetical protein